MAMEEAVALPPNDNAVDIDQLSEAVLCNVGGHQTYAVIIAGC